jgi:hypothetical protein
MPTVARRTAASPGRAQPKRPYPMLTGQASANQAKLARRPLPAPAGWARLHFLPARAAAAAPANPPRPDGAQSMRQADEGSVRGSESFAEATRRRPRAQTAWTAIATERSPTQPERRRARRPDAPDHCHCPPAVRSANSPPIPHLDAYHCRYHRIQFWYRPAPPANASARRLPVSDRNSHAEPQDRTCHIKGEYGQR